MNTVIAETRIEIRNEDDVVLARRKVRQLAQSRRFDVFGVAAVTTATSELARNTLVHGGGGTVIVAELSDGTRYGLALTFEDHGPGIRDIERVMAGGYSSTKTLGLGLSGSRRLVDRFEIRSEVEKGTTIRIEKWQVQ